MSWNTKAKLTVAMVALKDIAHQPAFGGKSTESLKALVALEIIKQLDATQPQEER